MQTVRQDKRSHSGSNAPVIIAYCVCAAIWGTTWFAIRVCIAPGGYPIYPAAAIRFTACAAILAVIWFCLRRRIPSPTRTEIVCILVAGALSGVSYGLLYDSEQSISGGIAAVIAALGPLVSSFIAMISRTEKPTVTTVAGSVVALLGVAIVFHDRLEISVLEAKAIGVLLFNLLIMQTSNVVMKRQSHVAALPTNTIYFLAAAAFLWTGAMIKGQLVAPQSVSQQATLTLVYLTLFGTLITFGAWFYMLKRVRLSTVMTLSFITPVIALVVDALYEKQVVLRPETYLGVGIVLLGVAGAVILKPPVESK